MATVDSLVLELGVKSSDLTSGLDRAASAIDAFASRLEGIGKLLDSVTGNAAPLGDAVSAGMETAERSAKSLSNEVVAVGNKAQVAANKMNSAFSNSAGVLSKLKGVIAGVFGAKLLSDVAKKGASLDRFQKQTGLDSTRADAWGKATERAGGSADAMRQALKDWTSKGQSEDEFYRLGEQMKGMNARQRSQYLRIRGVNEQAGAAFVEYGDQADKVASQYKTTAITPEQQKMARDFVESFKDLKIYIYAIATRVASVVLPIATNIFKRTKAFLDTLLKDGKTIEKLVMTIGAAFALKWAMGLAKSVMAMAKMVKLMKGATTLQKLFNVLSMANPIGLIVAALAVAVALIDDFVTFLKGGDSIIGDMVKWFSDLAPKIAETFGELFTEVYDSFLEFVNDIADPIIDAFTSAFDAVVDYFSGIVDEIGDALTTAFDGAFDSICDVFRNIYAFIVDTVVAPVEKFIGGLGDKLKAVKSFFGFGDKDKKEEAKAPVAEETKAQDEPTNALKRLANNPVAQENIYKAMMPSGVEASENPTAQNIVSNNSTANKTITNDNTTNVNYEVTVNGVTDSEGFQEATKNLANNSARALSKTYAIALSGNTGK